MTINISENSRAVIERRIAPRNEQNEPLEDAEQVFRRVANFIAEGDRPYIKGYDSTAEVDKKIKRVADKFYNMMGNLEFIPNSPTLTNAGRAMGQLSACFVLPVEDNLDGIFKSVGNAASIHKTGGGTGFSFSRLRPEGNRVDVTSGVASGPVSFMGVFDKATEVIKQGGTRRGANMGILRVDHPDILKFIDMKSDNVTLQNFNISVGITNAFMEALYNEDDYKLEFGGQECGTINSKTVWDKIISNAWLTGDPGIVFLDRINEGKANPVTGLGPIEATNPCGEQPLYPYDSCNLGSINLSKFIQYDDEGNASIDYPSLKECIFDAVHFLDNVIDMNKYPLPEIEEVSRNIRRIGLGVMGWANMLIALGIPYDSEEAINAASQVSEFLSNEADNASRFLGSARGAFPYIEQSIYAGDILRNSTRTTIAPTGTISIIADASSGIEPLYGLAFVRSHYLDNDDPNKRFEMIDVDKYLYNALAQLLPDEDTVNATIQALTKGSHLRDLVEDEELNKLFITAHDISPEWHVKMQAAWQQNVDNAVSKTINLPNDATENDIDRSYRQAWETGCKGVTVYRDGSKSNQVLRSTSVLQANGETGTGIQSQTGTVNEENRIVQTTDERSVDDRVSTEPRLEQVGRLKANHDGKTRPGIVHGFSVGDFEGYIIVGVSPDGTPRDCFIVGNKVGSATRGYLDTIGILTSVALRAGVDIETISSKLVGTKFEPSGRTANDSIPIATSVVDYIYTWLRGTFNGRVEEDIQEIPSFDESVRKTVHGDLCPQCGGSLFYGEGCFTCVNGRCGFEKCG